MEFDAGLTVHRWQWRLPASPRVGCSGTSSSAGLHRLPGPASLGFAAVAVARWRHQPRACHGRVAVGRFAQPLPEALEQLTKLSKKGNSAKAAELFQEIFPRLPKERQKKPMLWNLVLAAFSHSGDFDGALRWFQKIREAGVPTNKKAFGKMMEAAARAQRPDLAKAWMEKLMHELGAEVDPEVISILLFAYAKDGKVESAKEMLEEKIRSGHANLIDYNTVADAYAKRGRSQDVAIVERMLQQAEEAGECLDKTSYTVLMKAFARSSQLTEAAECLESMQVAQLMPDIVMHNTLLNAYCKERKVTEARLHLHQMMQSQLKVDAFSFTPIVQVCANSGSLGDAVAWLEAMRVRDIPPDVVVYTTVLNACAKRADAQVATEVFGMLRAARLQPDTVAMNSLIDSCAKCRDADSALGYLEEMKQMGLKPSIRSYTCVLVALGQLLKLEQAFELLEEVISSGLRPDLVLYNVLLNACVKAADAERAQQIFQKMSAQGIKPDVQSYSALVNVYAALGQVEAAANVIADMQEAGVSPNKFTWAGMLKACDVAADSVWACVTFRNLVSFGTQPDEFLVNHFERIVGPGLARRIIGKRGLKMRQLHH